MTNEEIDKRSKEVLEGLKRFEHVMFDRYEEMSAVEWVAEAMRKLVAQAYREAIAEMEDSYRNEHGFPDPQGAMHRAMGRVRARFDYFDASSVPS